tara:strand:+ start:3614 stop:4012 length:399 start_codon:yes stop_codon:yes gene_type:complete
MQTVIEENIEKYVGIHIRERSKYPIEHTNKIRSSVEHQIGITEKMLEIAGTLDVPEKYTNCIRERIYSYGKKDNTDVWFTERHLAWTYCELQIELQDEVEALLNKYATTPDTYWTWIDDSFALIEKEDIDNG